MGAADVLIDNAAGQTALQALAAGLPVVGYRPIPGHGAEGVQRMADLGLTDYARGPGPLLRSLAALSTPGPRRHLRIAAGRGLFDPTATLWTAWNRWPAFAERNEVPARRPASGKHSHILYRTAIKI